ncbi:redoxin domain-containing protein [Parapedobacter sp. ISTM3]|uniref:redoxin domain-containing protein n=1 Tax=Parapedobacter sp. ISTM3 TaxID=2800130 RepID=UPI001903A47F|nr:redoxin domain-containing protein [Parapedobacter sp. ISTM3]MBK1442579.1 redoxin domain-containing protein [Parapedobacter sp. ISTM3]
MKQKLRLGDSYALTYKNKKSLLCVQTLAKAPALPGLGLAIGVLALLLLISTSVYAKHEAHPDSITPLQIGDTIPESLWHLPLQVVNHPEGKATITLGDYRDKKLIILDFWATWCGSCISAIPKARQLESRFGPDMAVLFAGHNKPSDIAKFIAGHAKGDTLRESVVAGALKSYFPHAYIPHYVWLSHGRVAAITDGQELTGANITALLNGGSPALRRKRDVLGFDRFRPFSEYLEQVFSGDLIVQTMLTGYIDGLGGSGAIRYSGDSLLRRQNLINAPLIRIYNTAVGKPFNHFIIEASDESLFDNVTDDPYWHEAHTYCFEMVTPASMPEGRRKQLLIAELNGKLGLHCRVEEREIDCYKLVASEKTSAAESAAKGGKSGTADVVDAFNFFSKYVHNRTAYNPILVDGCPDGVRLPMPPRDALDGIPALNAFLAPFGVRAVPAREMVEVFVLSDQQQVAQTK